VELLPRRFQKRLGFPAGVVGRSSQGLPGRLRAAFVGTLIRAVIIGVLNKGLNQAGVHFSLQYIVKGLVILAAVYLDVRRRN
jgi:ABC-type xylose transport system permease subunit